MEEMRETSVKQGWLSTVKTEFENGPLASNFVFALLLLVLEKLVEIEFACPCKGRTCNSLFVATFFIVPGILASVLMHTVHGFKWICTIPAFVWVILLLFDGRYIACAMTDWLGRHVTADKAAPVKWCEPDNSTSHEERLTKSQDWYFHSQWAGLLLAFVMAILTVIIFEYKKYEESHRTEQRALGNTSSTTKVSSV